MTIYWFGMSKKSGQFSVKLAYKLAMRGKPIQGESINGRQQMKIFWNIIMMGKLTLQRETRLEGTARGLGT